MGSARPVWYGRSTTCSADQLYCGWLDNDPTWGFGWIGSASGYVPPRGNNRFTDHQRTEELLRLPRLSDIPA